MIARYVLLTTLFLALAVSAATDYNAMFEQFKRDYGRHYASQDEHEMRKTNFITNMLIAEALNARNPHAHFGVNLFADLSPQEFKERHNAESFFQSAKRDHIVPMEQIPAQAGSQIDWRTRGVVTPVKNQDKCGGCWAFSITGNIEAQWAIAGNPLTSLSEQELLSCDTTDNGCHGGLPDNGFEWLLSTRGGAIATEASYPFVSAKGKVPKCAISGKTVGATITGYHDIPSNEDAIARWVYAYGPVSIGVDCTSFQTYQGGILTNCIDNQLDHAVLIVGFDDTNNPPYWIIKNQWGASWGEKGYIRVEKGTNQCGLNQNPSTAIVGNAKPTNPPGTSSSSAAASSSNFGATLSAYTYHDCEDVLCTRCTAHRFQNGDCADEAALGMSFRAQCASSGSAATFELFGAASKCSGVPEKQRVTSGTCYKNAATGKYLKVDC